MKLSPPQVKALRTIDSNPGNVVYGQRTAVTKNFLRINGNTQNSLYRLKIATPRKLRDQPSEINPGSTCELQVWELTDLGRQELARLDAPAAPVAAPADVAHRPMPKPVTKATIKEAKAVTPDELTRMTPPQIDALFVALDEEYARRSEASDKIFRDLYHAVGVRKESVRSGRGYRQQYTLNRSELESRAHLLLEGKADIDPQVIRSSPGLGITAGQSAYLDGILARCRAAYMEEIRLCLSSLASVRQAVLALDNGPGAVLDREWHRRGGWTRFLLCTNTNGHIHNSGSCGTLYATTNLVRLPELSGLTEADAVRAYDTVLCSVCYPSAPVAWTVGAAKPAKPGECSGSRTYADTKTYNPHHNSRYAPCTNEKCGERPSVTTAGNLRAHQFKDKAAK